MHDHHKIRPARQDFLRSLLGESELVRALLVASICGMWLLLGLAIIAATTMEHECSQLRQSQRLILQ